MRIQHQQFDTRDGTDAKAKSIRIIAYSLGFNQLPLNGSRAYYSRGRGLTQNQKI